MKLKKLLALALAGVLSLSMLAACGGDNNGGQSNNPAPPATTPADGSQPAEDNQGGEPAGAEVEPLTIKYSSTFQQTETGGQIQQYFIDKVGELSGGAITVDITWGGTLFDSMGELDAVADGVVDMIALGHMPHLDTLPYLSFPGFAPGGTQAALDYFNTLIFDDPETSALIQSEAEALGIKYLNVIPGGANAFCTNYAYTDLDSMVAGSTSFGNFDAAIFEALGFQVSTVTPPECYDALNRGMINSTQMGFAPMVAMAWYEVAPFWSLDGTYTAGNMFTVNLDWWNGLTGAQRDCIQKAADETETYAAGIYDDAIDNDIKTVEDATGNKFVELSQTDIDRIWAATFEAKAADAMNRANTHGVTDGMTTILEKAAEITNYDWQH
ncbi:MAG: TRAP transporter substrate-binding protein DctP [Oscillospiraceae bacterium]|nr:TRAP transporter substrate-binding protein DctP [Oscillospiraceae bacterium]